MTDPFAALIKDIDQDYDDALSRADTDAEGGRHWRDVVLAHFRGYRPLMLYVSVPRSASLPPLVVFIHGGAWLLGHPMVTNPIYRRIDPIGKLLRAALQSLAFRIVFPAKASFRCSCTPARRLCASCARRRRRLDACRHRRRGSLFLGREGRRDRRARHRVFAGDVRGRRAESPAPPSVGHQHRQAWLANKLAAHAAKQAFEPTRMAICASDDEVGILRIERGEKRLDHCCLARRGPIRSLRRDPMALEMIDEYL